MHRGLEPKSRVQLLLRGPAEWSRENLHDLQSLAAALRIRLREVLREDMAVKGYASHEKETLENVIRARNAAISADGVADQAGAENMLSGALGKLFALSESYPNLKANENFAQLQEELTGTENKISFSRQHFNDSVATFNMAVQTFPSNVIAGMFNFAKRDMFELEDAAQREVVKVSF